MATTTPPEYYPFLPMSVVLPLFTALAIVSNYVPYLALYRVRNMPACTMIVVTALVNAITFVNALLWPDDNIAAWWDGRGFCDIQIIVRTVCFTITSTSTACVTKNLAQAVDTDNPRLFDTPAQRRRRFIGDLLFVFGIPFFQVALHYVTQANRFAVITIYGCTDILDSSWPSIALVLIWMPVFVLLNCYYAVLVMIRLKRLRGQLSSTLSSNGSGFTARRFLKLFFISMAFLIIYGPINMFLFVTNLMNMGLPLLPYSWSRIHDPASWNPIIFFTTTDYPKGQYFGWAPIGMSVFIFLYYGLNNEAIDNYRSFLCKCGFAKIWPSLKEPRDVRRRGSDANASWTTRLDFVSKAMNYLDTRKSSQATPTEGANSEAGDASRKNSHTPAFAHISLATVPSNTTTHGGLDPNHLHHTTSPAPLLPHPSTPSPTHPRPFLSTFRTHMHLPFPLPLPSILTSYKSKNRTAAKEDIEAQRRCSAHNTELDPTAARTVETNIWSSRSRSRSPSAPFSREEQDLKMGTRAYRDRETREYHEKSARVVADEVRVEKTVSQSQSQSQSQSEC